MKITRTNPSEATIQAELYMQMKMAGLRPVLEQVIDLETKTKSGRPEKIRVDLVVLDSDDFAIGVVELKNLRVRKETSDFYATRQHRKYMQLGIPFIYCTTMGCIPATIEWAKRLPA